MTKTAIVWPRQYAQRLRQVDPAKREERLQAEVPEHLRAMVRFHLEHAEIGGRWKRE